MKYKNITRGRGDDGTTDLCMGKSVPKTDIRIEAVGDIDEFHATLGLLHKHLRSNDIEKFLKVQLKLTILMGEVTTADEKKQQYIEKFGGIVQEDIDFLNTWKNEIAEELDLKNDGQTSWALYGQRGESSAAIDFSTTVCRRCERRLVSVSEQFMLRKEIIVFMNRLSKVLYLLARQSEDVK